MQSRWPEVSSFAAVTALTLALSGCGGSRSEILENWQRFEAGNPTLHRLNDN